MLRRKIYQAVAFLIPFSLIFDVAAFSQESASAKYVGPYCGAYCVYACLSAYGKTPDFSELLETKYIGSYKGSNLLEMQHALEDFGLHAQSYEHLGIGTLKRMEVPVILHVKDRDQGRENDHWMVYMGSSNGRARIIDPPGAIEEVGYADILARWNGRALVVSDTPDQSGLVDWTTYSKPLSYISLMFLIAILHKLWLESGWRFITARFVPPSSFFGDIRRAVTIVLLSAFMGCAFHAFDEVGFFSNSSALMSLKSRYISSTLMTYDVSQIKSLSAESDIYFIDARYREDYEQGHLPGAINLPVNSTQSSRRLALASIRKDKPVIVYCQSAGCAFSDTIASYLLREGYKDIRLFPGGWQAWLDYEKARSPSSPTPGGRDTSEVNPRGPSS
jgi:rhodanese-related sulfurtransferase